MPNFYGYTRASTAGQEYTFEAQRNKILAEYEKVYKPQGYTFGGWFEDKATSGSKPFTERENGLRVWACSLKGDVICVAKMDRAFRNVSDAATLLRLCEVKGIHLIFLDIALDTSTALGKFVAHLLASVAELEREWIRQRTKEAFAVRQEKGLPHAGRPPAGWKKRKTDGEWVHDEAERMLVEWMIKVHDEKGWSWGDLADYVTKRGIRRYNGHKYSQCWIHYALKAREAGYPGRDGWREECAYGGSLRRGKGYVYRRRQKALMRTIKADLQSSPSVSEDEPSESSLQSEGPDQTPDQTP